MALNGQRFFDAQLATQQAWKRHTATLSPAARTGERSDRFLNAGHWLENIQPESRAAIQAYLTRHRIRPHTMFAHLLSSQVFCLNFLAPFMARPEALADLLAPILEGPVLPVWLPGEQSFVAFEWISATDYLNEGGEKRQRGSQCTSVDAAVGFVRNGHRELLLIEWKYTESYGAPIASKPRTDKPSANEVRVGRYRKIFEEGIVKPGYALQDFFWEPFYQLLRQQLLAEQVERAKGDPAAAFSRATLAHVSPDANKALKRITAPTLRANPDLSGMGACQAWREILLDRDRYVPVSVEALFRTFPFARHPDLAAWGEYMRGRYDFLR